MKPFTRLPWERLQRERDQLQSDFKAIGEDAEIPFEKLSNTHVIECPNKMRARPWRQKNGGRGLTKHDLVELTNQPSLKQAGVDAIEIDPEIKVRKHFPNLYVS